MKSSSKSTIIVIVSCIVLVILYFYFEGGSTPSSNSLLQGIGNTSGSVGSAELSLLNQIKSLRIDTAIFTDPVYLSLQDYSVQIPVQNVGRPNPFAPLPGERIIITPPSR